MNEEKYFYVDVFPAGAGDCFMVRSFDGERKANILIDGGYAETFDKFLRAYLKNMKEPIDLLVVTHIDNDHINGIKELLEENGNCKNPEIVEIKEIWFNALRHLKIAESEKYLSEVERKENRTKILEGIRVLNERKLGIYDIGGFQGYTLQNLIRKHNYETIWNKTFLGKPVSIDLLNQNTEILIGPLKLKLLSPDFQKLENLKKDWLTHSNNNGIPEDQADFDDAFELYLQSLDYVSDPVEIRNITSNEFDVETLSEVDKVDTKTPNGSSIAFILDFHGTRALFLGDAHNDLIESELLKLPKHERSFRLVKLSHHGSKNNIGSLKNPNGLLNLIESKEFLISSDGEKHKHPSKGTIAKLLKKYKNKNILISCNYNTNPNFDYNKDYILKNYTIRIKGNENPEKYTIDLLKEIDNA